MAVLRQTGRLASDPGGGGVSGATRLVSRFGEALLFVDNTIFDVRRPGSPTEVALGVPLDDPHLGTHAVGIEFGWRHALHCACPMCLSQPTPTNAPTRRRLRPRRPLTTSSCNPVQETGSQPARLRAKYRALRGETGQGPSV